MAKQQQLPMTYSQLGKSELNISRIAFGCMSLQPQQADLLSIVDRAIDEGINYFDTADLYHKGINEMDLGRAVKAKRNHVIIASKVGNQWRADGSGWDWNPGKKYILASADQSLRRLQTDRIDLYQLHGGTIDDPIDDTIEAFEILLQQGKIRYYGISSIRPNVIREYIKRSNIVSVMMQYSLADRRPEESCLDLLLEHKIGVLARGSLASGILVGKPAKPYLNHNEAEIAAAAAAIKKITNRDSNAAATAIRFVLQHPAVTAAVVGIRTRQQLAEAIQAITAGPLSPAQLETLRESIPAKVYAEHR
jgi:aryl-alcohol dehydrogenase-like predicted oxidoreductase